MSGDDTVADTDPESVEADDRSIHVDGELVPRSEATVSVFDRGFRYGDAATETIRVYGGTLFEWGRHMDRLERTCELIGFGTLPSRLDLRARVKETLNANGLTEARVRLSITRGVDTGGLTPSPDVAPTVVVRTEPLPPGGRDGSPPWTGPATLQTVKTRRIPDRAVPSEAKTHNYLNGLLARLETRVTDADEALLLDTDGYVAEGATSNVFFVWDDALRTPTLEGPVLPGVTREVVLDLARTENIPVEEGRYEPDMLRGADELFLTSTTREIRPVGTVDGISVGGGSVTRLLTRLYDERVERACYDA